MIVALGLIPLSLWAQDNSWERPEEEEKAAEVVKVNPNAKYLRGAVPVVDGNVVFSKTVKAPGKNAQQIYSIIKGYMQKMLKEKNQINSMLVMDDSTGYSEIGGRFEEWLIFKKNAIVLDQTRFVYVLDAKCKDGQADLSMSRIQYYYEEERDPQRYKAEEWIVDDEAVNKKNTKLFPITGKFRRKTIDRKDFLFEKIESLLK